MCSVDTATVHHTTAHLPFTITCTHTHTHTHTHTFQTFIRQEPSSGSKAISIQGVKGQPLIFRAELFHCVATMAARGTYFSETHGHTHTLAKLSTELNRHEPRVSSNYGTPCVSKIKHISRPMARHVYQK